MTAVAAVFGSAVTGLYLLSRDTIARNRVRAYETALVRAFGLRTSGDERTDSEIVIEQITVKKQLTDPETGWRSTLIEGFTDAGKTKLKGEAFRFRGLGFWAPIEGILALTPPQKNAVRKTIGLVILEQTETPGLGGRISEETFTTQFANGINVTPMANGKCLVISSTPPTDGSVNAQHHVDAITGATQTCMAMERILNDHLQRYARARLSPDSPQNQ